MGDESLLRIAADEIIKMVKGGERIDVVGIDMECEHIEGFENCVDKAFRILGKFDAFVNCYTYEGI